MTTWQLDPAHSAVKFSVKYMMTTIPGRFKELQATLTGDRGHPEHAGVARRRADPRGHTAELSRVPPGGPPALRPRCGAIHPTRRRRSHAHRARPGHPPRSAREAGSGGTPPHRPRAVRDRLTRAGREIDPLRELLYVRGVQQSTLHPVVPPASSWTATSPSARRASCTLRHRSSSSPSCAHHGSC